MQRVLIIGATGNVGSDVRETLLQETNDYLTLFSRSANRLKLNSERETAIAGNVTNNTDLDKAMKDQDAVFVALSGNLPLFARHIVDAMKRNKVNRLIFISSMGIYNEISASIGENGNLKYNPILQSYRDAADIVEASGLNYTVIRLGWFTSGPVDYEVTHKGEPFGGHDVSIASIADLVKRLVQDSNLYSKESVGINTPKEKTFFV